MKNLLNNLNVAAQKMGGCAGVDRWVVLQFFLFGE